MAQAAPGGRARCSGEGCGRWGDIISICMHADGPKLAKNAVFANISSTSRCLQLLVVAASARARVPRRASISSDHEAGLEPLVRLAKPHVEYASSPRAATRSVRQRAQAPIKRKTSCIPGAASSGAPLLRACSTHSARSPTAALQPRQLTIRCAAPAVCRTG